MLFVAALIVGSGLIELALIYREVRDAAARVQRVEVEAAAVRIEQFFSAVQTTLADVSGLPWAPGGIAPDERREEYHRAMKTNPAIVEMRWLDRDGRERLKISRIEADSADSLADFGQRDEFVAALKKGYVVGTPYFRDGTEPFVTVAIRDRSPKANPSATLADINLKFVADVVRQIRLGAQGRVYVVDDADRLLAHPNLDLVLRKTELTSLPWWRELREAMSRAPLAEMIQGDGLESGPVLVSAAFVASTGWIVVAEQPRGEVLAPAKRALLHTTMLLLGGLFAALLVSYWLARRLSKPILEVRKGAEKIAKGDFGARIDVRTGDEVEALADEFNIMAAQLQQYTTGLERLVAEKTVELQEALKVANDAMRAKAMFLAAASHDLRQPLYAISILADALAFEDLPASTASALEKLRQAIGVLRSLFDNLLDLSRFDAGEVKPVMRAVSLRDVLMPLAAEYETLCETKHLAWTCDIPQIRVRTDPELLRRLVGNVLSNAVRYTDAGGVRLVAREERGRAVVEIIDTGIGIAPADQQRVFEEFVQIGNPSRSREKGVGLGLSIVRKVDELLGTNLTLDSAAGKGTRISLELAIAEDSEEPAARPVPKREKADLAGLRVWVVEDDLLVRRALAAQFTAWGVAYDFAANAADIEALLRKDGGWPDAAILDDMLDSGERGLDIARSLAAHMPMERVAFVTGNADPERLRQLHDSGFEVMRKPIAGTDLGAWLERAVRPSRVAAP